MKMERKQTGNTTWINFVQRTKNKDQSTKNKGPRTIALSQLTTLIWLKWKLFRNSLRSSKAVANRISSVLGMLVALAFALITALGLGVAAYALTSPDIILQTDASVSDKAPLAIPSAEFIFFSIFAFCYLMWASLPLSIGSSRQFEPGRLLIYPISLRKLFALDFISEIGSLQSVFAIPAIIAIGLGAGLGSGRVGRALIAALPTAAFGMALSKWLSVSVGSLIRRTRTRGETVLALIGVMAGLGGALAGQLAPAIFKHAESFKALRWTPPGAAALALTKGLRQGAFAEYLLALGTLSAYTILLILATYGIARRAVVGRGGAQRGNAKATTRPKTEIYTGWKTPLLSPQLSAIVEKELRYVMRNAQLRMMVLMPLILIVVRLVNSNRLVQSGHASRGVSSFASNLLAYGEGLMATGGVLYVFLILTGLSCNQFAFEEGGMRSLILSPVDRRQILVGKNIAMTIVALIFASALLIVNQLVFRDLTPRAVIFVALSFITFAATMALIGNWLSTRFPKRMEFGKRLNVSGMVGLLLIPMFILLALPPLAATATGYLIGSLLIGYVTLAMFAGIAVCSYLLLINAQGRSLERREVEILAVVREPTDD